MTQLTGLLTGTEQSDLFTAGLEIVDLQENTTEIGTTNATINALGGDDRIESKVSLAPASGVRLEAIGITGTTIDAGAGNDIVSAEGIASNFFDENFPRGPRFVGLGLGKGLVDSVVDGGSGNDTLSFIAKGAGDNRTSGRFPIPLPNSIGVENSTVRGGSGADKIIAAGDIGVQNSTIHSGAQQDEITISGEEAALKESKVSSGADNDKIVLSAASESATTVLETQVNSGAGDDIIDISSDADFFAESGRAGSRGVAVDRDSRIVGGAGNDSISIRSTATSNNPSGATAVSRSVVAGGAGDDSIVLSARRESVGGSATTAFDSTINGGEGDDTISFEASSTDAVGSLKAIRQSTVRGGVGNDTISFTIRGGASDELDNSGVESSQIYGGQGRDRITIAIEPSQAASADDQLKYDIADTLIFGGADDDTFDVGIGTGTLNGGTGSDTAVIDYFNAETMSINAIANGVQIVGTQTRSGTVGSWTQNIVDTENFQIGDTTYTAESLISTFAV